MKLFLVKQLNGTFKVAYDSDYEKAKKIKVNELYEVEIRQPRNIKFHNKFFALLELVYQNQEAYSNKDDMREDLTIEAGFYREVINLHGQTVKKAKSISFAKMDDFEFSELYSAFVNVVINWLKISKEDIAENIEQHF
jgi:hypothetical protein